MGITTAETRKELIPFDSRDFKVYVEWVYAPHLALFIGLFSPDKEQAVEELSRSTGRSVVRHDFNNLIYRVETESYGAIDALFSQINGSNVILWFSNGDKLSGAYAGFSQSKVKYATPQERYFLKRLKEQENLVVVIDITEPDGANETIIRAADAIVTFSLPKSPVRRILWQLKNCSLHGYDFKTKRPENYLDEGIID